MVLKLLKDISDREFDGETLYLSVKSLELPGILFFLASSKWDAFYCDLNENIPRGILKYIPSRTDHIYVTIPETINLAVVNLLAELFPGRRIEIWQAYQTGADMEGVLADEIYRE